MRTLWAILLGGLILGGTAEARLGETIEEIEKRVGKISIKDHYKWPDELVQAEVREQGGFDKILYTFFKNDSEKKCVSIQYLKYFERLDDVNYGYKDADSLFKKNFSSAFTEPRLNPSESSGISEGRQTSRLWEACWDSPANGGGVASVKQLRTGNYVFSAAFSEARYSEFITKRLNQDEQGKWEKKKKGLDAL